MKALLLAMAAALLLASCSQESKQEYGAAGQDLKSAAQNTGKAIVHDTKVAGQAPQNAATAAKNSAEKHPVVKVKTHK